MSKTFHYFKNYIWLENHVSKQGKLFSTKTKELWYCDRAIRTVVTKIWYLKKYEDDLYLYFKVK